MSETEHAPEMAPIPPLQFQRTLDALAETDDPAERRRLVRLVGQQLTRLVGQTANNAQLAVWSNEEWVRQQIGDTNEMIGQLAEQARRADVQRQELLDSMRQLLTLGQDTQTRMASLENAQGLMASHLSTLTEAITDLTDRFTGLDRRVGRLEQRYNTLADRLDRLEAQQQQARATHEPGSR